MLVKLDLGCTTKILLPYELHIIVKVAYWPGFLWSLQSIMCAEFKKSTMIIMWVLSKSNVNCWSHFQVTVKEL